MALPFENNTDKIVRRLAKRSLKADKRRNMFVILTISLAVCLMGVIAFIYTAQQEETVDRIRGQYQSGCINMSYEEIERLVSAEQFEKWGYEYSGGTVREEDTNLEVDFYDPGMLDLLNCEPITGSYPQAEDEICVERSFLAYFGLPEEINQTVDLDLGDGRKEYTVTGIIEKQNQSRLFFVWISKEKAVADGGEKPFALRFRFKGSQVEEPEQLRADIEAFYEKMGINQHDTFYSSNYFDLTDIYLGSDTAVYLLALLIAGACSIVIYSIFYISVMGKMKEYGRLKVIGATHKQLRRVVKWERLVLTLTAIPIGLAAAALITVILYPKYWTWAENLKYAAVISVLTFLVVVIATKKPLKLVGKVSAIEAVRTTAYTGQPRRQFSKRPRRRLTVPRLSVMNFSRSPKKAVITLASLSLTGIMVISISAYVNSIDAMEIAKASFGDNCNYRLTYEGEQNKDMPGIQKENPLDRSMRERLAAIPGVDYLTTFSAAAVDIPQITEREKMMVRGLTRDQMTELYPEKAVREGSVDYTELLEKNGILVVKTSDNLMKMLYGKELAVGDAVKVSCPNGVTKTYTVMGIVDNINVVNSLHFFILPEEELHRLYPEIDDFTTYVNVHVKEDTKALRQELFRAVQSQTVTISSVVDYAIQMKDILKVQMAMLYGLLVFIFLFSLLNLVNTLITNLLSRQQELGVFQSVGMSGRQVSRMLSYECLLYGGVTMCITLTLGTVCSIALCKAFEQLGLFGKINYHFPVVQVLIFAVALLLIQGVFSLFAVRYFRKQSLVERIRMLD